jgi:hypothetical protein
MKAKVTCRPARNFCVHDTLVKVVVSSHMDPVQISAVQYSSENWKEDVSAVSERWHCCDVNRELISGVLVVADSGQYLLQIFIMITLCICLHCKIIN